MLNFLKPQQDYTLMHKDVPVFTGTYSFSLHEFKEVKEIHNASTYQSVHMSMENSL